MSSERPQHPAKTMEVNLAESTVAPPVPEPAAKPAGPAITVDSPLPDAIVITDRLILRPMHPQDAPTMCKHANSPLVAQHMSLAFPSPYLLSDAHSWINPRLTPPHNDYAITLSSSPLTCIGGIGLVPGRDVSAHTAEIGYWIGTEFAGQGIMTEALEAFTGWVFGARGNNGLPGAEVRKLFAKVYAPHKASMRCLEKCGYVPEGVLKGHAEKFGEVLDLHYFGLTKVNHLEKRKGRSEAK